MGALSSICLFALHISLAVSKQNGDYERIGFHIIDANIIPFLFVHIINVDILIPYLEHLKMKEKHPLRAQEPFLSMRITLDIV